MNACWPHPIPLSPEGAVGFFKFGPIYFVYYQPPGGLREPRDFCDTAEDALISVNRLGPDGQFLPS